MKALWKTVAAFCITTASSSGVYGFNVAIWPGPDASVWAASLNLTNVVSISAGHVYAMALRRDGTVVKWGPPSTELAVTNAVGIASGACHELAVLADGKVVEWGLFPPNCGVTAPGAPGMPSGLANVVAAAGGHYHSLVRKSDGTCVSWGSMFGGPAYVPAGLNNVRAIAAGGDVSAALKSDGTVVNWGYTGNGGTGGDGLSGISAIAMGHSHGLALRSNGTVVVWGNTIWQPPVALTNVVKIGTRQNWACVLQRDGTLFSWGYDYGQVSGGPNQKLTNVLQLAPMAQAGMLLVGDGPPQPLWLLSNQIALAESTVSIKGEAVGTEPLSYRWFHNGAPLAGFIAPTLTLSNVQPQQAGSYFVVVSNVFGVRTNRGATLTVLPASIAVQPTNQTVFGGENVTMTLLAQGAGLTYQWRIPEKILDPQTNAQLTLSSVTTNYAGSYSVTVSNRHGVLESSNATLTVVPIAVISGPSNQNCYVGGSASFTVTALKHGPFTYQWHHEGTDVPVQTNASLTLSNVAPSLAGTYTVLVSNPYGSVESPGATLNVVESPPIITSQPASRGGYPGRSTWFQVVADGNKPLAYQWFFNGTVIPGATTDTLTLTNLATTNLGAYSVRVNNSAGSVWSADAQLTFLKVVTWGSTAWGLDNPPFDLTNVLAVAGGVNHSVALKSDGRVAVWGYNFYGQTNVPASATNVMAIAAAANFTLALRSNGTVVAWGDAPNVPAGLSNVVAIAAGAFHGVALKSDGTLAAWGVQSLTNVPSTATNVIAIAAGVNFIVALKADRTMTAWDTAGATPLPSGMTNVVAIAAGDYPLVALKSDGKLIANSAVNPIPANLSNVVAVAAGRYHALALRSNGSVTNWSVNPPTPPGLTNLIAIASGVSHCLGILGDGPQPEVISMTELKRTSNSFRLTLPTRYGRLYWLEHKDSLSDPAWKSLPLNPGTGNPLTITNTAAPPTSRFYRVRSW